MCNPDCSQSNGGNRVLNMASYDLIQRKLIISNPYSFYCDLKYKSNEEIFQNLKKAMKFNEDSNLYEEVLKTAVLSRSEWDDLLKNSRGIKLENYMTKLDQCIRNLTKRGYIESNHRTRINSKREVIDLKFVELRVRNKGEEALRNIQAVKDMNIEHILKRCIENLSSFASKSSIFDMNRNDLINEYQSICNNISDFHPFDFDHIVTRGIVLNYYEGKIEVYDLEDLKEFVNRYNNFELEKLVTSYLNRSVTEIYDSKVIIQALLENRLDTVYNFMREDDYQRHLLNLANMEYIRIDYSVESKDDHSMSSGMNIHDYRVRELGLEFYSSNNLMIMKDSIFIVPEVVKHLQKGIREKHYEDYFNDNGYTKNIIAFKRA